MNPLRVITTYNVLRTERLSIPAQTVECHLLPGIEPYSVQGLLAPVFFTLGQMHHDTLCDCCHVFSSPAVCNSDSTLH